MTSLSLATVGTEDGCGHPSCLWSGASQSGWGFFREGLASSSCASARGQGYFTEPPIVPRLTPPSLPEESSFWLPLYGSLCCRLVAQPSCMVEQVMAGFLKVQVRAYLWQEGGRPGCWEPGTAAPCPTPELTGCRGGCLLQPGRGFKLQGRRRGPRHSPPVCAAGGAAGLAEALLRLAWHQPSLLPAPSGCRGPGRGCLHHRHQQGTPGALGLHGSLAGPGPPPCQLLWAPFPPWQMAARGHVGTHAKKRTGQKAALALCCPLSV